MKTATVNPIIRTAPAYPNAASSQYFLRNLLDGALAVATVVGAVTALVFLFLL